jgi:ABC-type uncharacterized transport system ATPase subunit
LIDAGADVLAMHLDSTTVMQIAQERGVYGAGKSTLMNILTGLYKPDSGEIKINGENVEFNSPKDAITCGIGMVHQHFKLVRAFTVAEAYLFGIISSIGLHLQAFGFVVPTYILQMLPFILSAHGQKIFVKV